MIRTVRFVGTIALLLIAQCARADFIWHDEYAIGSAMGTYPSLALGPDGRPYIAHVWTTSNGERLMFTCLKDGEWVTELVDGEESYQRPTGYGCSLQIDANGNAHISYTKLRAGALAIKYAFKEISNNEWQIFDVIEDELSDETSLALDEDGNPHIIYYEAFITAIFHAFKNQTGEWIVEQVSNVIEAHYPSVVLASSGVVYVAYEYYMNEPYNRFVALLSTGIPNGKGYDWHVEVITNDYTLTSGRRISLALDSNDHPHVVRYDADDKDLWYFRKTAGMWEKEIIAVEGDVGKHCSIAIDSEDTIYIAYNHKYKDGENGALMLAYRYSGDNDWQIDAVDDEIEPDPDNTSMSYLAGTSIAVNEYGCLQIAYYDDHHPDRAGVNFVKYARGTLDAPRPGMIVAAPGPNPHAEPGYESGAGIKLFWPDGFLFSEFRAYGTDKFGAHHACGDIDGDGVDEIVTGPGPGRGYGPQVRAFEAAGIPIPNVNFMAYGTHTYGVKVACGDIDGDRIDELITGPGPGPVFGPHVRAFNYDGAQIQPLGSVSFFAYGTHRYGVNVSCADIDADRFDEILTGAGPGAVFGPHVRAWNYDGQSITPIGDVSYLAYGTNKYGVNVAGGDIDGDGYDEIITGPGPGRMFGSHVRVWNYDGQRIEPLPRFSFIAFNGLDYGVNIAAGDLNGDETDDIVAGVGDDPQGAALMKAYTSNAQNLEQYLSLEAFQTTYGTNVSIGENN